MKRFMCVKDIEGVIRVLDMVNIANIEFTYETIEGIIHLQVDYYDGTPSIWYITKEAKQKLIRKLECCE